MKEDRRNKPDRRKDLKMREEFQRALDCVPIYKRWYHFGDGDGTWEKGLRAGILVALLRERSE